MAAKKQETADTVEISKFFSRDNEERGKWYEPTIRGSKVGFEFRVYGPNSNAALIADDKYKKESEEIELIEDPTEKNNRYKDALARKVARYISDIRGADGRKITINGKDVTKEDIFEILKEAPTVASDILRFTLRQENFLD